MEDLNLYVPSAITTITVHVLQTATSATNLITWGVCRSFARVNPGSNQRGNGTGQGPTCFECGVRGYFKIDCPKLKNNNNHHGNQVRNANAPTKVYAVGHARTNPDSNV
ncbi:putative reverse transcriptase domain-containing protein [Tanacetum coccineum]